MTEQMRVAVGQVSQLSDEILTFARQVGVTGVQVNTPVLPGRYRWQYEDLLALRRRSEQFGLRLEAIENVPLYFYDKVMLGLPGRDEQLEHYQATIRNIGRAGIPMLGYHFMPNSVWRTDRAPLGRGGALVTVFDLAKAQPDRQQAVLVARSSNSGGDDPFDARGLIAVAERQLSEEQMWANYTYFSKAVMPVAEEAGVKLALHPDDPPVASLGGVARLFRDYAGFRRAMEIADSDAWGLDLCLGCWSEMGGEPSVLQAIEYFGRHGKILYVHFRDVKGTAENFAECFIGEGNYRPLRAMRALKQVGFNGFLLDDHVPHMIDDSPYGHRGRAHAIGYMQGLLEALAAE
ncbi:MAG TPA: mannonate dehydratase [Chloroflexota bacterium]|jgi:mannonate dehydratase|nr:mannonate dehydratase [Chloroflexota bacterium]